MNTTPPDSPATTESLYADLATLGVTKGDVLFVHSSYKSLGPLEDGVGTIIRALSAALGEEGLLLMPSFNLIDGGTEARRKNWEHATTPATTGYITEAFRTWPGVVRSDHYSHSVAALGKDAGAFIGEHARQDGMVSPWDCPPWGKMLGTHSPLLKAYRHSRGQLLLLGVDFHSLTYCHLVETMCWNERLRTEPSAPYVFMDRDAMGAYWESKQQCKHGRVGQAECHLFPIQAFVDTVYEAALANPERFRKQ